jgi:hypothetical protein
MEAWTGARMHGARMHGARMHGACSPFFGIFLSEKFDKLNCTSKKNIL